MYCAGNDTEYMGMLGLSWQEKLASTLFDLTGDSKLKNAWYLVPVSGSTWDVNYINRMESFYVQGTNAGLSGVSLASSMKTGLPDIPPATIDAYVSNRSTAGSGNSLETAISTVTNAVGKGVGNVMTPTATALTGPLMIIGGIAVIGFIVYMQTKKGK